MLDHIASPEYLPLAAGAVGAMAGSILDLHAQYKLAQEDIGFSEDLAGVAERQNKPSVMNRLGNVATHSVLWAGMLSGALNGVAWAPVAGPRTQPPHLEVVVDHSAATSFGKQPAITTINAVVEAVQATDLESEALLARNGEVHAAPLKEVEADQALTSAPLTDALNRALDANETFKRKSIASAKRSTGVLFITNDNGVTAPEAVKMRATELNVPIYVVNAAATDEQNTILTDIAKATKGEFWTRGTKPSAVAKTISNALHESQATDKTQPNLPLRALAAFSLAAIPVAYTARRRREANLQQFAESER